MTASRSTNSCMETYTTARAHKIQDFFLDFTVYKSVLISYILNEMDPVSILTYKSSEDFNESQIRLCRAVLLRIVSICRELRIRYPRLSFYVGRFGSIGVSYHRSIVDQPIRIFNISLHSTIANMNMYKDETMWNNFHKFQKSNLSGFDGAQSWADDKMEEQAIFDHSSVTYWKNSCYKIHDLDSFLRHVSEI